MNEVQDRRKLRLVVDRDFQMRFTLKLCLIAGCLVLAFGGLALYVIKLNFDALQDNALLLMREMVPNLRHEYQLLTFSLLVALILVIGVLYGFGLFLTQKIAGPLVALQRRLKEFGEGKSGVRLRLRKNDEFQNIETLFNYAMEEHDKRTAAASEKLASILKLLNDHNPKMAQSELESLLEILGNKKPEGT